MSEFIIETRNLTKFYHSKPAVNQIHLRLPQQFHLWFPGA